MRTEKFVNDKKGTVTIIKRTKKYLGKGIARCHTADGDTFSPIAGEELAEARADVSYQKDKKRKYRKQAETLRKQAQFFDSLVAQTDAEIAKAEAEVGKILGTL